MSLMRRCFLSVAKSVKFWRMLIYEKQVPAMFVPNVFSFATEGRLFRHGSIRMPIDLWGPWRDEENQEEGQLHHVRAAVESMLKPGVVLVSSGLFNCCPISLRR
jgi:hypothetical protein